MHITASTRSDSDSLRMETQVDNRHVIITDEPYDLGGDDSAPTPYELLTAALCACVATTVRMYARRKGWELEQVGVDAVWEGETRAPRCVFTVRLPDDLSAERRARLEQVAQACAVHRTLERGVVFEHATVAATG